MSNFLFLYITPLLYLATCSLSIRRTKVLYCTHAKRLKLVQICEVYVTEEDAALDEDRPPSPIWVLQHLSGEACRVTGEALQSVYSGSSSSSAVGPAHRRSQSEVVGRGHRRSNSFQRLTTHVQKAWRWGSNSHEEGYPINFNPEVLANQKRQWYQLHSKTPVLNFCFSAFYFWLDHVRYKEPTLLFEHFVVVGLHPDSNLQVTKDSFAKRKKWEIEMENSEIIDFKLLQQRGPSVPALEPKILLKYPSGKRLAMPMKDLASFCLPGSVKGQEHLGRDDSSFIFSLQVADNATLYGVCLHVPEIVQRLPGILGISSPLSYPSGGCRRFLVSAPRCYCVLTRASFFELHYEMLNSIIAQERLNQITQFVNDMTLTGYIPAIPRLDDQMNANDESPERESFGGWMASAVPVDSAAVLTAAAAGTISDDEFPEFSLKISEPVPSESVTPSDASELGHIREIDKDGRKDVLYHDDCASEITETHPDALEITYRTYENGHTSSEVGTSLSSRTHALERLGSSESLFSPARSMASEDEDDDLLQIMKKIMGTN
ncbi:DENN domain containing protein [Quillaja saponaria]|uniref:DENN domain containing protein n=1 Tax=Quillaja saponaria TaxID=32244 RepID=A0AAD7Q0H5_QUISA|nr:DENN domain containing protein [Quillaja saponaria]